MTDYANIDLFRIYSGATFAILYESFPISTKLNTAELVEHCNIAFDQSSRTAHEQILKESLRWLREMDYLRYNENSETFYLTVRSFEGLSFMDDPSDGQCRGEKLKQLTQKVGVEAAAETISAIVTKILGSSARTALSLMT